ncbi:DNA-methyltransferase, partial [Vibrio cholerae]
RVLKKGSHFYLFCDQETMFLAKPIAESVGFKFWKPIVWDKCAIGMGYHYRARYEFILFFEKGKRKLNDLSVPDVLEYKRVWKGYPTEKPVELLEVLIRQSSSENEIVADSFFGSGSTLIAANNLSRKYIGCDISSSAHEYFKNRA